VRTEEDLKEMGYRFRGRSKCHCGQIVTWWRTPDEKDDIDLDEGTYELHTLTCANRGEK
jgi:hypothetical protein